MKGIDVIWKKTVVNFRTDKTTKKEMEEICEDIGISIGTAFNIFAKKLIRERRIPFELDSDPFYRKENIERLKKSIEQMEKTGGTVHEVDYD